MLILKQVVISLFILISLTGCESIKANFFEEGVNLSKELTEISLYIAREANNAEQRGINVRYNKFYKAEDELAESCGSLQTANSKKFFEEALTFWLKITTIFSFSTCEDKIHEMQKRFPDYNKV